ncbi:MAG: hypothetical protein IKO42_03630 [Opitutales bacterium]|nr:hypothetical protein [Opitutales bacterium]
MIFPTVGKYSFAIVVPLFVLIVIVEIPFTVLIYTAPLNWLKIKNAFAGVVNYYRRENSKKINEPQTKGSGDAAKTAAPPPFISIFYISHP